MIYLIVTLMLVMCSFVVYYMKFLAPYDPLWSMFCEVFALVIAMIPSFIILMQIYRKRVVKLMSRVPSGKALILFIRRNGEVIPLYGKRAYSGESFLDMGPWGTLHDLGNTCHWGDTTMQFGLENVNHTVDPHYANFTKWLYDIGFNNIREIKAVLDGEYPEKQVEVLEKIPAHSEPAEEILARELSVSERVDKALKKQAEKPTIPLVASTRHLPQQPVISRRIRFRRYNDDTENE